MTRGRRSGPAALALVLAAGAGLAGPPIETTVDPGVELVSIVFRLAGSPEYNMPNSASPYADDVARHFGPFAGHAAVQRARALRASKGISYDAVMSLARHIGPPPECPERPAFEPRPALLESRWTVDDARGFLGELRDFATTSDFDAFRRRHAALYTAAAARLGTQVEQAVELAWFDDFFGARPQAEFTVAVGLLCGGGNYGVSVRFPDGRERIGPVIGAWRFDAEGVPVFDEGVVPTLVHEFAHAYVNAIVDRFGAELEAPGTRLFAARRSVMERQAYGNWRTVMYETFVRSVVIQYLRDQDGAAAAAREAAAQRERGFDWVPQLAELLEEYSGARERYADLDAFMPRCIELLARFAEELPAASADAPRVIELRPANGAQDVPADLAAIVVTFDRPMQDGSWSVVGGGPNFPEIRGPLRYDAARRVLTIPVKLKPDWDYAFGLNGGRFMSFRSAQGVPLEPLQVRFRTAP